MIRPSILLLAFFCTAPVLALDCESLASAARFTDLVDAPTHISAAEIVPASEDLPAHCRVRGFVEPNVQFELRLPALTWNGKLLMQGCGGLCGEVRSASCDDALDRGYAVVATDMGHEGPAYDSAWARDNLAAEIDFAYRATHVVAVAADAIVSRHYVKPADKRYFRGCSTGGRQALVSAQRFPEDFDGIIAGAPVLDETGTAALHLIWSGRANLDARGEPVLTAERVAQVRQRVLAACDDLDGVADGIIADPRSCDWRAALPACDQASGGRECFHSQELEVLGRLYDGAKNSRGESLVPGGLMPGSEYEWVPNFVGRDGPAVFHPDGPIKQLYQTLLFFDDLPAGRSASEFDFDKDPLRLAMMEVLYSAKNPDLRKFRARGGKMILYQGWDDVEVTPLNTIDYFETMQRTMGGKDATSGFARLFMLPGVAHCRRGPGADAVDWLGYLERWVEADEAPDEITAYKLTTEQNYLGLPRPRFPLAEMKYSSRQVLMPYGLTR